MTDHKLFSTLRKVVLTSALPLTAVIVTTSADAFSFSGLYVFGDSLSDTGNVYRLSGNTIPPSILGYDDGRFSNGPVWVESLASRLGVTFDPATNFAFAGATTGALNTTVAGLPGLQQQISGFTTTVPQADPNALYVIWAGSNDYLGGGETNPATPVNNLVSAVRSLVDVGARNIVVTNLGDLGPAPLVRERGQSAQVSALVGFHNTLLAQSLNQLRPTLGADVNLIDFDVNTPFQALLANPGAYGITNTTDACLYPSPLFYPPTTNISRCSNPEQYVYWDSLHPTAVVHTAIADAAYSRLEAAAVPEPSETLGFVTFGAFLAGAALLKRKKQLRSLPSCLPNSEAKVAIKVK